jgi:hypothetical protein
LLLFCSCNNRLFCISGAGLKPSPDINIGDSGVVGGDDRVSNDIPSTSACIHDPATVSVDGSVSLPPATTEAGADKITSSLAAKPQTKGKYYVIF